MNTGLVGCGNIGSLHASILAGMDSDVNTDHMVHLLAFADFDVNKARNCAQRYMGGNAGSYASLEEMLGHEDLQAVHICTPHYCHVPMAELCLERNINVLMEKPPAMNRKEFSDLKKAQEKSQAKLGIVFQNRYNPTTQVVDELLKDNRIHIGDNDLLKIHMFNSALKISTEKGKSKLIKIKPSAHIDGMAALLDAMTVRQKWYGEIGDQLKNEER